MKLKGIVLAGGKSSRFGEDKALARWNGKTLMERAVELLDSLRLDPVVIANSTRDYSFLTCPIANDLIPEKGPLGGLYTACSLFPEMSLLVLTCDMPLLTQNILNKLIQNQQPSDQAVVFNCKGALQPFPGIYPGTLKEVIRDILSSEELSMKSFLSRIRIRFPHPEISELPAFENVNRKEDLNYL